MSALHVLHVASEVSPHSSSGGLGNVIGSLAPATAVEGAQVTVLSPKYRSVNPPGLRQLAFAIPIEIDGRRMSASVFALGDNPRLLFLDIPELYDRDGLYGEGGIDYPDNLSRFVALSRAALELPALLGERVDVFHVHDWQAALVAVYRQSLYAGVPAIEDSRVVQTIHNLAYQGLFESRSLPVTGLDWSLFTPALLEFYGKLNLLKGGIVAADAVTTVSRRYAREILLPDFGFGLEGVLGARGRSLTGVLNGIDVQEWDPAADLGIAQRYAPGRMAGKAACKRALQRELGLEIDKDVPLFGIVTRLAAQKGTDLLVEALPELTAAPSQWAILGTGDPDLERRLLTLAAAHGGRVAARIEYDASLAHRIFAGADFTMLPSRFEPCGLAQMYALRYGTIPVVSDVGGLGETVIGRGQDPVNFTGVRIGELSVAGVKRAVAEALAVYRKPRVWPALRRRAMASDFSWSSSVKSYLRLYSDLLAAPPSRPE